MGHNLLPATYSKEPTMPKDELIGEMGVITSGEYYRFVQAENRAALTEPTDG